MEVPLGQKAMDVLLQLLSNHGRTMSRVELLELVWKDVFVADKNLTIQVSNIRRALGDPEDTGKYIETGHKSYCFVGDVNESRFEIPAQFMAGQGQGVRVTEVRGADPANPPWMGPLPYTLSRASDFFGRETEVEDLVRCLRDAPSEKRVVFLYSPSGAGKSSLINAGLRHRFLDFDDFELLPTVRIGVPVTDLTPGQNPITQAVIASTKDEHSKFPEKPITLSDYLLGRRAKRKNTILILDQAEELLIIDDDWGPQLKPFFIELRDALITDPSLRILFAFREEYLAQLQRVGKEITDFSTLYPLAKLRIEEAKLAIQLPAGSQGVVFDPQDLLDRLVLALCDYTGEFVEPMQLQLVCIALWRGLHPGARKLSWEVLKAAVDQQSSQGRELLPVEQVPYLVNSVLQDFCERAFKSANEHAKTRRDFNLPVTLIELGCEQFIKERRTRALVARGKHWTGNLPNVIVDALVDHQLLRIEQLRHERLYELAHDTLIQPVLERADLVDDDSLRSIFSDALRDIAKSERARKEGIDENLIAQKSCLLFVSPDGDDLQVSQQALKNSGWRLPEWLIDEMAQRGVLRKESHQDQDMYQLSHWRFAQVLHQDRSRLLAQDRIFRTRKLLGTYLEQCLAAGASLDLWYRQADQLLKDIKEDFGISELSEHEAMFVLRANLSSERPLASFTAHLSKAFPSLTADILREATQYHTPLVRRNAVAALRQFVFDGREDILLNLALSDPDEAVGKTAADALANLEGSGSWERLFSHVNKASTRSSAITVIAWMFDAMPTINLGDFETHIKQLSLFSRVRMRLTLTSFRITRDRNRILVAWVIALAATTLFTVPIRAALATFNLTITQLAKLGFFEGIFNGFAGAITWSVFIGGSLLLWWYLVEGRQPWQGRVSPWIGAFAGLLGGIVNTIALVNVYLPKALAEMHWIRTEGSSLSETVTVSHLAYAMPLSGFFVGLGVGQAARKLLPWSANLELHGRQSEHSELIRLFSITTVKVLKNSWLILLPTLSAAVIVRRILPEDVFKVVGNLKLVGEAISVSFGGVGLVIGILYGSLVFRMGWKDISGHERNV